MKKNTLLLIIGIVLLTGLANNVSADALYNRLSDYWKFNNTLDNEIAGGSTLSGGTNVYNTNGAFGQSLLPRASGNPQVSAPTSLRGLWFTNGTIDVWINGTQDGITREILAWFDNANGFRIWSAANDNIVYNFNCAGAGQQTITHTASNVWDGNFHRNTIRRWANGTIDVFFDGIKRGSATYSGGACNASSDGLYLIGDDNGATATPKNSSWDEFRIWNTSTLTDADIAATNNSQMQGDQAISLTNALLNYTISTFYITSENIQANVTLTDPDGDAITGVSAVLFINNVRNLTETRSGSWASGSVFNVTFTHTNITIGQTLKVQFVANNSQPSNYINTSEYTALDTPKSTVRTNNKYDNSSLDQFSIRVTNSSGYLYYNSSGSTQSIIWDIPNGLYNITINKTGWINQSYDNIRLNNSITFYGSNANAYLFIITKGIISNTTITSGRSTNISTNVFNEGNITFGIPVNAGVTVNFTVNKSGYHTNSRSTSVANASNTSIIVYLGDTRITYRNIHFVGGVYLPVNISINVTNYPNTTWGVTESDGNYTILAEQGLTYNSLQYPNNISSIINTTSPSNMWTNLTNELARTQWTFYNNITGGQISPTCSINNEVISSDKKYFTYNKTARNISCYSLNYNNYTNATQFTLTAAEARLQPVQLYLTFDAITNGTIAWNTSGYEFNGTSILIIQTSIGMGDVFVYFNKDSSGNYQQQYVYTNDNNTHIVDSIHLETPDLVQTVRVGSQGTPLEHARVCASTLVNQSGTMNYLKTFCAFSDKDGYAKILVDDQHFYKFTGQAQGYSPNETLTYIEPASTKIIQLELAPASSSTGYNLYKNTCGNNIGTAQYCNVSIVTQRIYNQICFNYTLGGNNSLSCGTSSTGLGISIYTSNSTGNLTVWTYLDGILDRTFNISWSDTANRSVNVNFDYSLNGQSFKTIVYSTPTNQALFFSLIILIGIFMMVITARIFNDSQNKTEWALAGGMLFWGIIAYTGFMILWIPVVLGVLYYIYKILAGGIK